MGPLRTFTMQSHAVKPTAIAALISSTSSPLESMAVNVIGNFAEKHSLLSENAIGFFHEGRINQASKR